MSSRAATGCKPWKVNYRRRVGGRIGGGVAELTVFNDGNDGGLLEGGTDGGGATGALAE